ncbi:hypothetical protein [Methanospirillum sp.]|uniref:hypothetical protein n=1 Tax=Methanospirillum sp. TaxID=45200 RepID=UPI0029858382|nr:hypothetical protein [Methanospirillum sp.]
MQIIDIDMSGLVRGIIIELISHHEGINISVTKRDLISSKKDSGLIRQMWYNLISNSIKFTSPVTISDIMMISSHEKEKEIIYYVKDNSIVMERF